MKRRYYRFPGFKTKAVTFSYDDGTNDDKLTAIMNKYGIKGTFNLNSYAWEQGILPVDKIKEIYVDGGHEIASHGYYHINLNEYHGDDIIKEVYEDRKFLEKASGTIVRGFAYPCGKTDEKVRDVLKNLGIKYARTTADTHGFDIGYEWLTWNGTCHHTYSNVMDLIDRFNACDPLKDFTKKCKLFYLWGHAWEFERDRNWDFAEKICQKLGGKEDVWYATNGQIYDYIKAYNELDFSLDGTRVHNPTATDVYFEYCDKNFVVKSGETLVLDL